MMLTDMVILESPFTLICFGTALFFCIANCVSKKAPSALFSVICILVSAFACVYALLKGASMQEVLIVVLAFFIVDLLSFSGRGRSGDK